MDSIQNSFSKILLNEDKLLALHWLCSVAFFANFALITVKSFFSKLFSQRNISSACECYYIRGLLAFRMFSYGVLSTTLIYYWFLEGSYRKDLYFLPSRITVLEALCECIFYYIGIIFINYNPLILLSFMAEAAIQIMGEYDILKGVRVAFILIMIIEIKKQSKNGLFGNWIILLMIAVLFPIIPMALSMICQ